jgi:hypothetical protein
VGLSAAPQTGQSTQVAHRPSSLLAMEKQPGQ